MLPPARLSAYGRAYIATIILLGFCVVGGSVYQLYVNPIGYQWFLLAALTLMSGSATVKLPSVPASISISETFVFTAILLYGPAAGTLIVALDGLVISYWIAKRRPELHRALFNMAAPALSAWCAAQIFFWVAHVAPLVQEPTTLNNILPGLFVSAVAYFALNSWLITLAISAETKLPPLSIWRENFIWLSLNYFCGASVAALLVIYRRQIDIPYIGVIVPLLLVLYFTFKTSMDRVEDANKHVDQVNRLYLSTVETLAMAIDAKDQITHGHIRRVQKYATGLARALGVGDESLIKAIETAALLHDMGKLAVPEYILNKPGKLTGMEFEKMKLHASVGADILSAIDFPYPVVPIVRHHHESWNGSGYPSGLKGTEIPVGARILSVVDCFDALTSDRPYRPRLSDEEALRILIERRGTMYDPLVVDTFVRVHADITPEPIATRLTPHTLDEIASSMQLAGTADFQRLDDIAASADEMLTLYELARALTGQASVSDTGDVISKHLRRLIPFAQSVLFLHDRDTAELIEKHSMGDFTSIVKGLRIPVGQRLSGWVGANRQTIVNSDPTLDFGDSIRSVSPRLRSCLSAPLISDDQLVGVLSLYSQTADAFNDDHRRIIEVVAKQIGHTFKCAAEFDSSARRDNVTELTDLKQLEQVIDKAGLRRFASISTITLLFIDVADMKEVNTRYGRHAGDSILNHVVRHARSCLRMADLLFRYGGNQFVALLSETDTDTAKAIGFRIQDNLGRDLLTVHANERLQVHVRISAVSAPHDGASFDELMSVARTQVGMQPSEQGQPRIH